MTESVESRQEIIKRFERYKNNEQSRENLKEARGYTDDEIDKFFDDMMRTELMMRDSRIQVNRQFRAEEKEKLGYYVTKKINDPDEGGNHIPTLIAFVVACIGVAFIVLLFT